MKPTSEKASKKNGCQSDDDNIRYKINLDYFNNTYKSNLKNSKKHIKAEDDDDVRYKFPTTLTKSKPVERKPKPKSKIKVNFWSSKQVVNRLNNSDANKQKTNRRHTIGVTANESSISKPKNSVKVRKRVSFLPSPLFSENHVPMVTVPDDLTIQLNEEEANDLGEDLNLAFVNSNNNKGYGKSNEYLKRTSKASAQTSPRSNKRKRSFEESVSKIHNNDHELEFFTKYVVQKLRRMETNQRIYSENLINTVLMLGQLGELNGKSKIAEI